MKNFVTGLTVFTTALMILLSMSFLIGSAKMTAYLIKRQENLAITRGDAGILEAQGIIYEAVNEAAKECSRQTFHDMTSLIYDNGITISEAEAHDIYKNGFLNRIRYSLGKKDNELVAYLNSKLPALKTGELRVDVNNPPYYSMDEQSIFIKNINLTYSYKDGYEKTEAFDVCVPIGHVTFYDGNEELFEYSLIGAKGIYITGKTSTIFGNVYAGTHEPVEMREAEALFGERNYYGGLNIMATQLAMQSDKIVSEGAVNMKGSFVLFGNATQPAKVIAKEINETDNIASRNIYELIGEYAPLVDVPSENILVNEAMRSFDNIEFYYDSNNDKAYIGEYRKIISSSDITLHEDVTGIVMTPRSVIVEEGVNVEGLILSGDRIYIQGNNNIVSSLEALRGIIKEEKMEGSCIDETKVPEDNISSVHLRVIDYLGGIDERGVK